VRTKGIYQVVPKHEPVGIGPRRATDLRTLEERLKNADVFLGVSVKGAVTAADGRSWPDNPVIFAMANPDPEKSPPKKAHEVPRRRRLSHRPQ